MIGIAVNLTLDSMHYSSAYRRSYPQSCDGAQGLMVINPLISPLRLHKNTNAVVNSSGGAGMAIEKLTS